MAFEQQCEELKQQLDDTKIALLNFGHNLVSDGAARAQYTKILQDNVKAMLSRVDGTSSLGHLKEVAQEAKKARDVADILSRENLTSMGKVFSDAASTKKKTMQQLLDHYAKEVTRKPDADFHRLSGRQTQEVYTMVIKASGASDQWLDSLSKNLDTFGRSLMLLSVATSVMKVYHDEHPAVAGALLGAEYFGVAVVGIIADAAVGTVALACGFGAIPVIAACFAARVRIAVLSKEYVGKAYEFCTQDDFIEHRNQSCNYYSAGEYEELAKHNKWAISGAVAAGLVLKFAGGGFMITVSGALAGAMAGHCMDVWQKLRRENVVLRQRNDALEAELQRCRNREGQARRERSRSGAPRVRPPN